MDRQKLRNYVQALLQYSQLVNNNDPLIIRRTNSFNGLATVFVVGHTQPDDVLIPINSYWVNSDPNSADFRKLFYRESIGNWVLQNISPEDSWHVVEYDTQDSLSTNLEVADTDTMGTVSLSTDATDSAVPVVLTEGDSTLDNARSPLPHLELHPEIPASQIATASGGLHIDRSLFGQYKFMTVVSDQDAYWQFASLPIPGDSVLPTPTRYDRDQVSASTDLDATDVTNVEVFLV